MLLVKLTSDFENVLGDSSKGIWLSSSITILTVVLSPPVCQAADYWGRRWFLIILTLCGTAGSIIVARASSMNLAIAGQIICGIAFGLQGLTHAVMSEVLPRRYRPLGQAVATVSAGLGGVTSLLLGGALTRNGNHAGFRNYWYTAMALYALAAVLCYILYNPPVRQSQMGLTNAEKLAKLDWIGYILLSSGLVALCMGLSWSQNPYGWTDAHVLATFLIGLALIACLALYATKFKKDGMFHHGLFSRGWNFVIALACLVVDGLAFFAMNIYFCSEVGTFYESDTLITGFRYSITFIMSGSVSFLAGAFCSSNKSLRFPTAFAFGLMTIFFICMATATQGSSKAVWAYPVIFGAGFGVTLCTILAIGQLSTPKELLTIATGVMISLRSFGGTIGLAVCRFIFQDPPCDTYYT
jgi:MFS family permease